MNPTRPKFEGHTSRKNHGRKKWARDGEKARGGEHKKKLFLRSTVSKSGSFQHLLKVICWLYSAVKMRWKPRRNHGKGWALGAFCLHPRSNPSCAEQLGRTQAPREEGRSAGQQLTEVLGHLAPSCPSTLPHAASLWSLESTRVECDCQGNQDTVTTKHGLENGNQLVRLFRNYCSNGGGMSLRKI